MFSRFFKSISCFNIDISEDEWHNLLDIETLKQLQHIPIKQSQKESIGFSSVTGYHNPDLLYHHVDRFHFLSVTRETKKVSKLKVEQRVVEAKRTLAERRKVATDDLEEQEIQELKEKIEREELSKKSPDEARINLVLDPLKQRMYVDTVGTDTIIKKTVSMLRKLAPSFKVHPFATNPAETILTQWLYNPNTVLPDELALGNEASLKSPEDSKAKLFKQDLESEEVKILMNHGKQVFDIAVSYQERIGFTLNNIGYLKKVKPRDMFYDGVERIDVTESYLQEYQQDWELLVSWLTEFYDWLEIKFDLPKTEKDAT